VLRHCLLGRFCPWPDFLVGEERHRRHLARPMTALTGPLKYRGDVFRKGDRGLSLRRLGRLTVHGHMRHEGDAGDHDCEYAGRSEQSHHTASSKASAIGGHKITARQFITGDAVYSALSQTLALLSFSRHWSRSPPASPGWRSSPPAPPPCRKHARPGGHYKCRRAAAPRLPPAAPAPRATSG